MPQNKMDAGWRTPENLRRGREADQCGKEPSRSRSPTTVRTTPSPLPSFFVGNVCEPGLALTVVDH